LISTALGAGSVATNVGSDFASGNLAQGLVDSLNLILPAVAAAKALDQTNQTKLQMNPAAFEAASTNPAPNVNIPDFASVVSAAENAPTPSPSGSGPSAVIETVVPVPAGGVANFDNTVGSAGTGEVVTQAGQTFVVDLTPTSTTDTSQTGPQVVWDWSGLQQAANSAVVSSITLQTPLVMNFISGGANLAVVIPAAYANLGNSVNTGGTNTGFLNGLLAGEIGGAQGASGTLSQQLHNADATFTAGAFLGVQVAGLVGMLPLAAGSQIASTASSALQLFQNYEATATQPLALPGPAPGTQSPWSGTIFSGTVADQGITASRVYNGSGDYMTGQWSTLIAPESSSTAINSLSLPPVNTAEFLQQVQIPGGTQIQFGIAAPVPAWGTTGGGLQIQLLGQIPDESFQFWDVLPYK